MIPKALLPGCKSQILVSLLTSCISLGKSQFHLIHQVFVECLVCAGQCSANKWIKFPVLMELPIHCVTSAKQVSAECVKHRVVTSQHWRSVWNMSPWEVLTAPSIIVFMEFYNFQLLFQLKKKCILSEIMHMTWCIINHFYWSLESDTDYHPN